MRFSAAAAATPITSRAHRPHAFNSDHAADVSWCRADSYAHPDLARPLEYGPESKP
jgi:hypothetical protein